MQTCHLTLFSSLSGSVPSRLGYLILYSAVTTKSKLTLHSPAVASGRGRAGLFDPSQHKGNRSTLLYIKYNTDEKTEVQPLYKKH